MFKQTAETSSVRIRIRNLKKIAEHYYLLADGALIKKHTELLKFFDVRGSKHEKHPHKKQGVYISRRALKHIVERRKKELAVKHNKEAAIASIHRLIDRAREVLVDFDFVTFEPPSYIYAKRYSESGEPFIRVIVEETANGLEIKTIHFSKNKRIA